MTPAERRRKRVQSFEYFMAHSHEVLKDNAAWRTRYETWRKKQ